MFKHCPACNGTKFNIFLSKCFKVDTEDYIPQPDNIGDYLDHSSCTLCGYQLSVKERESLEELLVWEDDA